MREDDQRSRRSNSMAMAEGMAEGIVSSDAIPRSALWGFIDSTLDAFTKS